MIANPFNGQSRIFAQFVIRHGQDPEEARRAIIAHELAHVTYYAGGNRIRLVGLIRLASKGFRERFERRADLDALRRGYAQGLKQYCIWLYQHVTESVL